MVAPVGGWVGNGGVRDRTFPFQFSKLAHRCWYWRAPKEVTDKMIFTYISREIVDSWRTGGEARSEGVEMRAAEHVGFANYAGGNGDRGDGRVEFCVRGREEELFQKAAISREERRCGGPSAVAKRQVQI